MSTAVTMLPRPDKAHLHHEQAYYQRKHQLLDLSKRTMLHYSSYLSGNTNDEDGGGRIAV
ncbi:hypothetical protein E2C01_003271 [Portunus trituberculatus]|uniref:Uncharacterized protein n=1 Tax=Portunus trituberculatus TaxID=210409 RepID=A0A5B7CPS4_PORTR|nr:hypothetical protein [Portunus trituberculatus]